MTDYFALLDQPRRPWLDEQQLKEIYHAKTRQLHPDANAAEDTGHYSNSFAELNDAYRTLCDPKLRLDHLLRLANADASANDSIPPDVQQLFPTVSSAIGEASGLVGKIGAASSALTRGLLQPDLLRVRTEVERVLATLARLHVAAVDELRSLDASWAAKSTERLAKARRLQLTFGYLARWIAQLEELRFQLSNA
jgi:curved DNA-binding protein CbpA